MAECSFGPAQIGAQLNLDSDLRPDFLAFHEGPSRILISTGYPKKVAAVAARHGVVCPTVGVTIERAIEWRQRSITLGSWEIAALRQAFEGALEEQIHAR